MFCLCKSPSVWLINFFKLFHNCKIQIQVSHHISIISSIGSKVYIENYQENQKKGIFLSITNTNVQSS